MKTTVEISDSLLAEAHHLATRDGTSVRALIEEGLRRVVEERQTRAPFRLRRVTFQGRGLHPDLAGASWDSIRDLTYDDHGS